MRLGWCRAGSTWSAPRSRAATSLALEGLVEAEVKLSAYRRALHERIDACTAQLVDHYQRDPAQIVR